jgi:endonuclease/exonuclease/phosphatase family metal-dependent hydrolase
VITVATWNVLHRVHAENWYEDVAERWPDEAARIAAIAARVARCTEQVIALQEVSGDQLAELRRALPDRAMHALRYPRIPRPRRVATALRDRAEYLLVLVDGPSWEVTAEPFADDPGKGALAVRTGDLTVVATHVTGDQRRTRQLTRLAELAPPGPTVLLGDFNTDRDTVAAGLGGRCTVAAPAPDSPPTRPRDAGTESQFIDHVAGCGVTISDVAVESAGGLSDHNLVRATVAV